jgi:hypothetical protein
MSTSTIPLFGRAYKLTVQYAGPGGSGTKEVISQQGWEPEALRITFDILQSTVGSPFWFADISIYNLNDPTIQNYLFNAVWATLEAGYQNGPSVSSIIWDGPVMRASFDRENVVDYRINLQCVATIPKYEEGIVADQYGPGVSQAEAVAQMVASIDAPAVAFSTKAAKTLGAMRYPRGKTVFGRVSKYIFQMADSHFFASWQDGHRSYISELMSAGATPQIVYGPPLPPGYQPGPVDQGITRSIIGTPRQDQFGVEFRVLLDPRLKVGLPPLLVKLDNVVISQMKAAIGQIQNPVDSSALCVVGAVRHVGDSRGNDWYTEVSGYWRNYTSNLLEGVFATSAPE